jgi:hypothetical protein
VALLRKIHDMWLWFENDSQFFWFNRSFEKNIGVSACMMISMSIWETSFMSLSLHFIKMEGTPRFSTFWKKEILKEFYLKCTLLKHVLWVCAHTCVMQRRRCSNND